jgi:hypothetical protein
MSTSNSSSVPDEDLNRKNRRKKLRETSRKIGTMTPKIAEQVHTVKRKRGGVTILAKILPPPGETSRVRKGMKGNVEWTMLNLFVRVVEIQSKNGRRVELLENGMRARIFHEDKNPANGKFEVLRGKGSTCVRYNEVKVGDRIFVSCFRPTNTKFQDNELVLIGDIIPKWRRMSRKSMPQQQQQQQQDWSQEEDDCTTEPTDDELDRLAATYGNLAIGGENDGLWVWDLYSGSPKCNWEMDSYVEKVLPVPTQKELFEKFKNFPVQNQLFKRVGPDDAYVAKKRDIICAINVYPEGQEDLHTREFVDCVGIDEDFGEWSYEPAQQAKKKNASMTAKFCQDAMVDGRLEESVVFVKFSGYEEFVEAQYAIGDVDTWEAIAPLLVPTCPAYLCCQEPGSQQDQYAESIKQKVLNDIEDECEEGEAPEWRAVHATISCGAVDLATGIRSGCVNGKAIATQLTWEEFAEASGDFKRNEINPEVQSMQKGRRLCGPEQPDVVTVSEIASVHKEYMYGEYDFFAVLSNQAIDGVRAVVDAIKKKVCAYVIFAVHHRTRIVPDAAEQTSTDPATAATAAATVAATTSDVVAMDTDLVSAAQKGKSEKRKRAPNNAALGKLANRKGKKKKKVSSVTALDDSDSA